ncbi:hypothetical protein QC761_502160 [Podospora bellae-mahoneyi]|uniref:Uncharacterized protein n=1 Tax=Podospora bellae-mahoneyi TaxID=2093777 RepID=A0ABR0FCK2_9PEZI|nr:hypothetical protein QC761_502160 [Podospora bellae-mahoneyi]
MNTGQGELAKMMLSSLFSLGWAL